MNTRTFSFLLTVFLTLMLNVDFSNSQDLFLYAAGPSGGSGGEPFDNRSQIPVRENPKVFQIAINSGAWIDGINIVFTMPDGTTPSARWAGGTGGHGFVFNLREDEQIAAISGTYDQYVNQIMIHTNRGRNSPMYGTRTGGNPFKYEAPSGCQIVGFHGTAGKFLDSLGVYFWCP